MDYFGEEYSLCIHPGEDQIPSGAPVMTDEDGGNACLNMSDGTSVKALGEGVKALWSRPYLDKARIVFRHKTDSGFSPPPGGARRPPGRR